MTSIVRGERTKSGRPRAVPIDPTNLEILKDLYNRRGGERDVFFHEFYITKGRRRGKVRGGRIQEIMRAFDLRHTASTFAMKRYAITVAQALLGHADIKTTQLCTHLDVEVPSRQSLIRRP